MLQSSFIDNTKRISMQCVNSVASWSHCGYISELELFLMCLVCLRVCACMRLCVHALMCTCVHVCAHACMPACNCVFLRVCVPACDCVCISSFSHFECCQISSLFCHFFFCFQLPGYCFCPAPGMTRHPIHYPRVKG